jgi:predicted DNA binding protein
MISAQFRIRLPEHMWITELSEQFQQSTFRLLTGKRVGERAIELGEVTTDRPDEVVEGMQSHDSITEYEVLEQDDRRVMTKYETTDTDLYEFAEYTELVVEFPIVVKRGWYEFDLTGTRDELDGLRSTLEAGGFPYELRSLVGSEESERLLTARQRELLEAAVRNGYFEVPRECTLEELATRLDIDKSTASTVIRRGEARILHWFISGPERRTEGL